jgi:hypothetical protein
LGALGAFLPPYFKSPHVSIKPLVLRIAKHLLAVAIPRFILIEEPLLFLHTMAQSWCGVAQSMEPQTHPLIKAISRFIQMQLPLPPLKPIHAVIEPSALRAAKATAFE